MTAPLQASAKYSKVTDDPQFHTLSPEDQSYVLDRVDPEFKGLNAEDKASVITGIRNSYNPPKTNFFGDLANHFGNAAAGYTQDQAIKNSGHGVGSFIGDFAGGMVPVIGGSVAGGAAGTIIPGLGNAVGAFTGGILGAGAGGAAQDLQAQRLSGLKNPDWGRAATSGVVQGGLQAVPVVGKAAPLLKRLAVNALVHGGGAAAGDVAQQGAEQHTFTPNLDLERLKAAIAMGAGGGSLGAFFHKTPNKIEPGTYQGKDLKKGMPVKFKKYSEVKSVGHQINNQVLTPAQRDAQKIIAGLQNKINEAMARESISHEQTVLAKKAALKKLYENLSFASNLPGGKPLEQHYTNLARQKVLEAHATIERHYQGLYGKQPKAAKAKPEHITSEADIKALVGLVKEMRAKGNTKQADVALGAFTRETKARVYDEVKRQEALEKHKLAQAKTDNKALNKGESQVKNRENKQLKGAIQNRAKEAANEQKRETQQQKGHQSAQGKPKTEATQQQKRKTKAVDEPRMSGEQIRSEIKKAEKSGESVTIRYRAEKHGETGEYEYKTIHNPKLDITRDGKVAVRGINNEGQIRTYLERDPSGSEILSVQRDKKPSEYRLEANPETNKQEVRHIESGEIVAQVKKEATKSSDIRSALSKMERIVNDVNQGKRPPVSEIMDTARNIEKYKDLQESMDGLSDESRRELIEKVTGEPC